MKKTISKEQLRRHVREALGIDPVYEPDVDGINVSSVVDPQSPDTVPVNPNFSPQDSVQFSVAVRNLVKNLPDSEMPGLYDTLKAAVDDCDAEDNNKEKENRTKEMTMNDGEPQAESIVREQIRGMIAEHYEDPTDPSYGKESTFKDIAAELGFSVAGAKQAVDKAVAKANFLGTQMSSQDITIMTMNALKDYISKLQSSGELTASDAQLMADHPQIVTDLDGFREFLHRYVKRRMK